MNDKVITVRLTHELYNMLQLKSKASGMNTSEYIRNAINNSEVKMNYKKDIGRLIGSINKIGNNINQIAHNINIARSSNNVEDIDYNNILDKLTIVEYQLKEILKGV